MRDPAKPDIHLCIVQPVGYVHSLGLLDAAQYFRHQFRQLGAEVTISKNRLRRDATNLVFGAHLGFDPAVLKSFPCVFVNLEQLGDGGSRVAATSYLDLLRGAPVIDYDAANCGTYAADPASVPLISFGYAPYLGPVAAAPAIGARPVDLLFFGSMNPRRSRLIERIERTGRTVVTFDAPVYGPERDAFIVQARAVLNCHHYDSARFEQVRAFQVLSLGTPLVSERTERTRPGAAFEASVSWFDEHSLEEFFTNDYARPDFAARAERQLQSFRAFDPRGAYAAAMEYALAQGRKARAVAVGAPLPQRALHIGSGKDYRPGWLNVDVLESAQPDLRLDLSQPLAWPARFESPFWGSVQLEPGKTELIVANNVLEHVPDLPALMRNCLELLRVGGVMVIDVPYEKNLGAWQDPTHVRAMNENSWLYFTDWFWYLGWFEYRFRMRALSWVDLHNRPCAQRDAMFMQVKLEKVPTTVAERMVARTMRPDFGGLIEPVRIVRAAPPAARATAVQLPLAGTEKTA